MRAHAPWNLLVPVLVFTACGGKEQQPPPAASEPVAEAPAPEPPPPAAPPLRVAYSDWPGWTAFEVGIQKGWFKEAGVEVEFSWFDYLPSMEAFSAETADSADVADEADLAVHAETASSAPLSGYQRVYSGDKSVAAGQVTTYDADCPVGKVAIAGGFYTSHGDVETMWGYVIDDDPNEVISQRCSGRNGDRMRHGDG